MRYISLEKAESGMILAQGVYNSLGRTLVSQGVELNENYISKLKEYGFYGIYIDDELSKGIEIQEVISPELRAEGMASVQSKNVDACRKVAQKIVDIMLEKGEVSLDMTDLRSYDDYTFAHSVNVAVISCAIAIGMSMPPKDVEYLATAALLHDLGKLDIPAEILKKPERLTPEEFQVMKTHSRLSYELISDRMDLSAYVKTAVLFHHENEDGSGYPQGMDGKELTLHTKILHVADVYDALISKRSYKEAYAPNEAAEYLMGACGIQFDGKVVETLLRYVPLYPKGTEVTLSDGREGIVYENSGFHNMRPIVRLMNGAKLDLMEQENFSLTIVSAAGYGGVMSAEVEASRKEMMREVNRPKIMVVDDMKANLQLLNGILEDTYEMILVNSGSRALSYLKKNPAPDLILMDIDMPGMNGIQAVKEIQRLVGNEVPIIFVTSHCDKDTVLMCRSMDAASYIVRPFKPVYVKSEVERILKGWCCQE